MIDERLSVTETLEVKNEEGKVTASITLNLGEMKLRDVLLREQSRLVELLEAVKAQLAVIPEQ